MKGIPVDPVEAQARRDRAQAELDRAKKPIESLAAWDAHEHLVGIVEGRE